AIPRLPRSTLFPYTTLFRSQCITRLKTQAENIKSHIRSRLIDDSDHPYGNSDFGQFQAVIKFPFFQNSSGGRGKLGYFMDISRRSEEHTSELQSRENLVCRL